MTSTERRATALLAAILILRMTALFMVLPVLAPYALELAGQPVLAVGLAVGAYGLTQAFLQVPFGWLSDRIGRKPVIAIGLAIFAGGCVMAALAESIEQLVVARLLQGGGAIAAASIALLADLVREQNRTTALAIVGASIGGSFLLALILGPALLSLTDVPGLFVLGGIGAALAALMLIWVPHPEAVASSTEPTAAGAWLSPELLGLDLGVLALHAVLASVFIAVPLRLIELWHWPSVKHWQLYLPVMLLSLLPVFPLIRFLEKRGAIAQMIPWAVLGLGLAMVALVSNWIWMPLALVLFFAAFNFLEASLPSQLSKRAPGAQRGRAMGVFSSAQFFGAFAGAGLGGWCLARWGSEAVLWSALGWVLAWLLLLLARKEWSFTLSIKQDARWDQCPGRDG